VGSMTDLFHQNIMSTHLEVTLSRVFSASQHTYLVLTKRAREMRATICNWSVLIGRPDDPPANLWLGVTVENQQAADERIPYLLDTPAAVRFVSLEPLLGEIDISEYLAPNYEGLWRNGEIDPISRDDWRFNSLDWAIIGCESGPKRRPCKIEWVRDLVRQCRVAGVPVFVKQLDLDGRVSHNPAEWPEWARVREYPK